MPWRDGGGKCRRKSKQDMDLRHDRLLPDGGGSPSQPLGPQRVGARSPLARRRGESVPPGGAGRGPDPPLPASGWAALQARLASGCADRQAVLCARPPRYPGCPASHDYSFAPWRRAWQGGAEHAYCRSPDARRAGTSAGRSGMAVSGGPGACGGLQARRGGSWEGDREGDAPPQGGQGGPCRRPGRRRPSGRKRPLLGSAREGDGHQGDRGKWTPFRPRFIDPADGDRGRGRGGEPRGPSCPRAAAPRQPPAGSRLRSPRCPPAAPWAPVRRPAPRPGYRGPPVPLAAVRATWGARGVGRRPDRGRERRRAPGFWLTAGRPAGPGPA